MWRAFVLIGLIAFCSGAVFCQSVNKPPSFVIAEIHPSPPGSGSPALMKGPFIAGDRFELRSATVLAMIRLAYSPADAFMVDDDNVIGGPSRLDFDRYDITARTPLHSSYESTKLMLRTLLAERFKVVLRNDSAPRPAYALTAGKQPLLKQAGGGGETGCKRDGGPAQGVAFGATVSYSCRNMTMPAFVDEIRSIARLDLNSYRVVDQTGIKGAWDFEFRFSPLRLPGTGGTTFIEAVQKQLGLDLTLTKVATPVLVVAGANEKPSPNSPEAAKALPPLPQEFEVASVKPAAPDSPGYRFQLEPGGRVEIHGTTLRNLIVRAWGLNSAASNEAVTGPKFIDTDRFDISAKAPTFGLPPDAPAAAASDPTLAMQLRFTDIDSINFMLRTLLIQRFGLTFHNEERPLPAFRLTLTKSKLQKADPSHRTGCRSLPGTGPVPRPITLACENITMAQFAATLPNYDIVSFLSRGAGSITNVIDATNLSGAWDFTVSFTPGAGAAAGAANPFAPAGRGDPAGPPAATSGGLQAAEPGGVTFFEAIEKQTGLKLEKIRVPGPVIVIDHLEEKPREP